MVEAAGVRYDEFSNIADDLPVRAASDAPFDLPPAAAGTRWIDGLCPDGAQVLARYEHPHFGRWAAVTTHPHGLGRVTYLGTVPNRPLAAALFRWLVSPRDDQRWQTTAPGVTSIGATARNGQRVRFLHNWSWEPATVRAPIPVRDLLSGRERDAGAQLDLGAWDVRVFVERPLQV